MSTHTHTYIHKHTITYKHTLTRLCTFHFTFVPKDHFRKKIRKNSSEKYKFQMRIDSLKVFVLF